MGKEGYRLGVHYTHLTTPVFHNKALFKKEKLKQYGCIHENVKCPYCLTEKVNFQKFIPQMHKDIF